MLATDLTFPCVQMFSLSATVSIVLYKPPRCKLTISKMCWLVGQSHGIEPAFVGDIPAAVSHAINSKPVALGPVTINLTNIVETRGVVIRRLEVLRLKHLVRVRKLDLPEALLALGAAKSRDFRGVTSITCNDGHSAAHDDTSGNTSGRHCLDLGRACSHVRLAVDHNGLLSDGLLLNVGWLLSNDVTRLVDGNTANGWLLKNEKSATVSY